MSNVLFVTSAAPIKSPFSTKEKSPPIGLGFLISTTRNAGHNVYFIDNYLKPSKFIEDGFLQKYNINYVAIYSNTICYRDTLRMVNDIEKLRIEKKWHGKVIVGGPHTSIALETIPKYVDYIVQGEGEEAILNIIDGNCNEKIIKGKRLKNLDNIPFAPWDIFSKLEYDFTCDWIDAKPVFTMNTSRGCPFSCTFCSVNSIWGKEYTYMKADRIIAEIKHLIENYGAKGIYFREDNFTLNHNRLVDFCRKVKPLNISWACESRIDNMNEETIKIMSGAGCKAVYLGVESGSQRMLDLLKKGITVEQIRNAISMFKKHGVNTYCSLITGLPNESYEDYKATKNLMKELNPMYHSYNVFVGIPGSPLYKYIEENGIYEYRDELNLLYLPGYDVRVKKFYSMDPKNIVDYNFKQKTEYDNKLMKNMLTSEIIIIIKKNRYIYKSLVWCKNHLKNLVK